MGVLVVRTVDDRGQPTGARIHLTASDGKVYAPANAYARVSAAGEQDVSHRRANSASRCRSGRCARRR